MQRQEQKNTLFIISGCSRSQHIVSAQWRHSTNGCIFANYQYSAFHTLSIAGFWHGVFLQIISLSIHSLDYVFYLNYVGKMPTSLRNPRYSKSSVFRQLHLKVRCRGVGAKFKQTFVEEEMKERKGIVVIFVVSWLSCGWMHLDVVL